MREVLAAHEYVLATSGGAAGIRDLGAIESAIARPYCGYYRPIAKKAAAIAHSLALNHGFVDANKRTALFMMGVLLWRSGYTLRFSSGDEANREVEKMILAVVEHQMNFDQLAAWVEQRLRRR